MYGHRHIFLDKLHVSASIGILPEELEEKQSLLISLTLKLAMSPLIPVEDDVNQILDYREIRQIALDQATAGHINMLETLAGRICKELLALPTVIEAIVRIDKPSIFPDCNSVAVSITANN
jgi:dihydroneopterin aldolase